MKTGNSGATIMEHFLLSTFITTLVLFYGVDSTPLDDYVNAPDPHYNFTFLKKIDGPGFTIHILNLTSQKWLDETVTTKPIWWHYLSIIIPDEIDYKDSSYLWIDQGHNSDKIPDLTDNFIDLMIPLGVSTKSVVATIKQIPNQPTEFVDDPTHEHRSEDSIIAWTWMKFIKDPTDPRILLRMPMTKAVVRGMDTVTTYVKTVTGNKIETFVVGGASKRGWTTWTTAAVDKRVIAMTPCVMDLLNLQKNLHHHYRSLGGWTFAFKSYYELNITRDLDNPNILKMMEIIDPLAYKDRYTMPKLVLSTTGDEFFFPDDSHYYYNQLTGTKFLRIVPNGEHTMVGHIISVIFTIRSFYLNMMEKANFPTVTWQREQTGTGGKIVVKTSRKPSTVTMYHARTLDGKRRDFRIIAKDPKSGGTIPHPVLWFKGKTTQISDTEYQAEVERPVEGWAAFFIQVSFEGVKNSTLEFTTESCIVPDVFPFPDCSGEGCYGELV